MSLWIAPVGVIFSRAVPTPKALFLREGHRGFHFGGVEMFVTAKRRIVWTTVAFTLAMVAVAVLANDKATWVLQTFSEGNRILYTKGLSGSGELVTMADGGPWMDHPGLSDPNRPFDCANPNGSVGSLHRKVQSWTIASCSPGTCMSTHGTHDAGTILGDAPNAIQTYNSWEGMDGHAYAARLAVFDIGVGQCQPTDPVTGLPRLTAEIFQPSFDLGSRIISEGFGTVNPGTGSNRNYNKSAEQTDQFAWDHKDYLIVIGAGNEDHNVCQGHGTACSVQADCPHETCLGGNCEGGAPCHVDSDCPQGTGPCQVPPEGNTCQISGTACTADVNCPLETCGSPANLSNIRCEAQAKNVITVGSSQNGDQAQNVSTFSSWGPSADGRIKPTLMVPGEGVCTASPNTGDGCLSGATNYETVSGTSFSHPAASGNAALVRQYFRAGYYPGGTSGGSPTLLPSAALLKAVMINSAEEMTGSGAYPNPAAPRYPNNAQGWGRMRLDSALYFSGDTRKLVVCQDKAGMDSAADLRQVSVNVPSGGGTEPLEATLVWTDPPRVTYDADATQLVNDLDLLVKSPSNGPQYKGNVFTTNSPHQSDTGGSADHLNVEEDVLRFNPSIGAWTVQVTAFNQPLSNQPFALAITGNISLIAGANKVASSDYSTNPGQIFQNNYTATFTSNDTYEVLKETSGGLTHTWKFTKTPCGTSRHLLHIEASRPNNPDGDNFQFYYSTDGVNYSAISGALVNKAFDIVGGTDYAFDDAGLMGHIYIQVRDTVAGGGSSLDTLKVDYLEIR
ncbi:MAG TPA: S8 family serine peptidase [Candidatus Polarisedimenticolia bacterium]|nr:S8 family serine peptidase [Candidatus Polarisedimenticolia bacterium]